MTRSVVFLALLFFVGGIRATISLAQSGYPMPGGNPQRNFKVNKPVLCSDVSRGKTTVLNEVWRCPARSLQIPFYLASSTNMFQDGQGSGYILSTGNLLYKVDLTDGSYNSEQYITFVASTPPLLTMLQDGRFYSSGDLSTWIGNTSAMSLTTVEDQINLGSGSVMVPYKNDWLVRSRAESSLSETPVLYYFQDSTGTPDTGQPNIIGSDFGGLLLRSEMLMMYKSDNVEFPIIILTPTEYPGPSVVASPAYLTYLDNANVVKAMVVDDKVIMLARREPGSCGIFIVNAITGAVTLNKTYSQWSGEPCSSPLIYHNGMAVAKVLNNGANSFFVDLVTGTIVLNTTGFTALEKNMAFSTVENTAVAVGQTSDSQYEITGFLWDSFKVNLRGRLRDLGEISPYDFGDVTIGDNCQVHINVGPLVTLEPLPIQNVIPILECVDRNTRVGYFTYNNTGSQFFSIPQVDDRNNLTPGAIAPVQDFIVGLGPLYPVSAQVTLDQGDSYTWVLEDYVLSFTITSDLYCPESINIIIILTGDSPFPQGFGQTVRNVFVSVTGISDGRITLVSSSSSSNPTKRSIKQQSTLETEIQISPDPNKTEPTPSEVVQQFTETQKSTFEEQIQQQDGAPSNINSDIAGKAQSTAIQGKIPPAPVAPPMANAPTSTPTQVQKPTSMAHVQRACLCLIFSALLAIM